MDRSLFKNFKTSRGFNYHYYFSPPQDGKVTLFFAHGFPSNADSWHKQAPFFQKLGYGVLVPDLLGYGESDKPVDTDAYRFKYMVVDITEIFDHEKIEKVVAIGHDWGVFLVSRLANYYHDDSRLVAFGFFGVNYQAPSPADFDAKELEKVLGYWFFFSEDEDAGKIMHEHLDSFFSLVYSADLELWKTHFGPPGALKKWLLDDKKATELDEWAKNEEEYRIQTDPARKHGVSAGFNWYRATITKLQMRDDAEIPKESYVITKPTFFAVATRDTHCVMGKQAHAQLCPTTTYVDFDTGHWIQNALPDKVNDELLRWINSLGL